MDKETFLPVPLRWVRILASAATVIGMAGLLALMTDDAWSAPAPTRPDGFQSGQRTFSNPFAAEPPAQLEEGAPPNQPVEPEEFADDEEIDEEDFPEPSNQGRAQRNQPPSRPTQSRGNGVTVGGSPGGGVISHGNAESLGVDTLSGEGSRAVVTDFNFPDADIMDIARALGKLTGKNFLLDKDVKGRITIISNSPITVADAWKAFLTALDMNGFAIVPSGKYIRIARQRDARDKQLRTFVGDYSPDTDALITRVFPLQHLSADEVARTFRSFMPANARIIPYDQTNTVIVTDTGANIQKLSKLLEILDVETHDARIEVIPVKYASATDLSKLIDTLLPGMDTGAARPGPRTSRRTGTFAARRTQEGGVINNIIADERTNSLIVHASNKGIDQVRELVAKLDQRLPAVTGGGKVHVIYLQFADSEQIATTLQNLSQQAQTTRVTRPGSPRGGTGTNPIQASLFEGSIRVSPDKATNSLVVTASPSDFNTIQRVIAKLDIPRDQVYAEVIIMELSVGRNFQFSSNIVSPIGGQISGSITSDDLTSFFLNPLASKGAVIGWGTKNKTTVSIGGEDFEVGNIQALVKLLQTKSNGNILATPQILALDNSEATFETAERIPVPTTTAIQGAGVQTGVEKENISLSITIKPQINKIANFVKLDVQAKLEDISQREPPAQVQGLAFATVQRSAKTSIVVANQDTVVLGGLTRDVASETVSKVPILGDIPLLGWLFKSKRSETAKTNLLIFITPHIIRQYESIRAVLDKKLKQRDEFIEQAAGGEDPLRPYRDEIIRGLPDIKEVAKEQPHKAIRLDNPSAGPLSGGDTELDADAPARPVDEGDMMPLPFGEEPEVETAPFPPVEDFAPPGSAESPDDLGTPPPPEFSPEE